MRVFYAFLLYQTVDQSHRQLIKLQKQYGRAAYVATFLHLLIVTEMFSKTPSLRYYFFLMEGLSTLLFTCAQNWRLGTIEEEYIYNTVLNLSLSFGVGRMISASEYICTKMYFALWRQQFFSAAFSSLVLFFIFCLVVSEETKDLHSSFLQMTDWGSKLTVALFFDVDVSGNNILSTWFRKVFLKYWLSTCSFASLISELCANFAFLKGILASLRAI